MPIVNQEYVRGDSPLGSDPMDPMLNTRGDLCPLCGAAPVVHQAVNIMMVNGFEVLPQCYGVCDGCHREEYNRKYGYFPEDAHRHVPKKKRLISDSLRFRKHEDIGAVAEGFVA